ncbi:MAG TPA: hypothetical protein VGC26_01965 [Afipia sp.]
MTLNEGDALLFEADVRHSYRNLGGEEAIIYPVMRYVEVMGGRPLQRFRWLGFI